MDADAEVAAPPPVTSLRYVAKPVASLHVRGDLEHPAIGLVILLVVQVINIYKPPRSTRYGWRKQQQERSETSIGGVVSGS